MTPERENLIRDVWGKLRYKPFRGDTLIVPLPVKILPETITDPSKTDLIPRLAFTRGVEIAEDRMYERFFVECEGLRVEERVQRAR